MKKLAEIPAEVTSGALARALGVTERVVAGRKADGRVPVLPNGHIDLRRIVQAGVEAMAHRPRAGGGGDDRTRLEAYDQGQRLAVWLTANAVFSAIAGAPGDEEPGEAAARGLRTALDLLQVAPDTEVGLPDRLVASEVFMGGPAGLEGIEAE